MLPEWLVNTLKEIDAAKSVATLVGLLAKKQAELLKFFDNELCNFKNPAVPNYNICEVDEGLKALVALRERVQEKASQLKKPSIGMQQQFDARGKDLDWLIASIRELWERASDLNIFRGRRFGSDFLGVGRILGRELDAAGSGRVLWQKLLHRGIKNPVIREMVALVPLSEESLAQIVELNTDFHRLVNRHNYLTKF